MSDEPSPRCLEAQAANTLWMQAGRLHADNTDGIGLLRDLHRYVTITGKNILLLGAGGAARGIIGPLLAANPAQLMIANRTPEKAEALQEAFPMATSCAFTDIPQQQERKPYDIVINATSASLEDQNLQLPAALMTTKPFCYDLAYRQNEATAFVAWARTFDCIAMDGLGMLVEQAAESFAIWHGVMPDTAPVLKQLTTDKAD